MLVCFGTLPGTCGVGLIHNFGYGYANLNNSRHQFGGIGYNIAGFVNTAPCKRVYEIIKRRHEIVFQSPVRRNSNSGRQFFFIVYKRKER